MNNDRAVQFAPFDSLRGYYTMVQTQQRQTEPRRRLSEEEEAKINALLLKVKKGDMLRVSYYNIDRYETRVGVCHSIDLTNRTLTVLDTLIPTDDIIYAEIE
ncbi:MAG: hypothetical protein IJF14_02900 [Clostridia bacterium]|nr:hypothetical protein [Clostridia bacterium]